MARRDRVESPPEVPDGFWETDELQAALATQHMGRVIRACRHHAHHGRRPLSQQAVGRWVGRSQAAISRLEVGPPPTELQELRYWARLLGIPEHYLWFTLSEASSHRPAALDSSMVRQAHRHVRQLAALLDGIVEPERAPDGAVGAGADESSPKTAASPQPTVPTPVPADIPARGELRSTHGPPGDTSVKPLQPADDAPGYVDPGGIPMTNEEYANAPTLPRPPINIDTRVAQPARMADYLRGGGANFTVDRDVTEYLIEALPGGADTAIATVQAGPAFEARVVRYLVGDMGVRQILYISPRLPTGIMIHDAAQEIAPDSRIVYIIDDDIVMAHAHTVRTSTAEGLSSYLRATLDDAAGILRRTAGLLDYGKPVAVFMLAGLNTLCDDETPREVINYLLEAVPSGSYLVLTSLASDLLGPEMATAVQRPEEVMRAGKMRPSTRNSQDLWIGFLR